jgi:cellulose 1,4-beta-cellobiosidase
MKKLLFLLAAVSLMLGGSFLAWGGQGNKAEPALKATVVVKAGTHSAALSWTAPTTCVDGSACTPTGYNVYRAVVACPASGLPAGATKIASAITTTTYTDTTITAPGSYCYYVTALNAAGESACSNTAGGTLAQPAINAPTNFTVTVQ